MDWFCACACITYSSTTWFRRIQEIHLIAHHIHTLSHFTCTSLTFMTEAIPDLNNDFWGNDVFEIFSQLKDDYFEVTGETLNSLGHLAKKKRVTSFNSIALLQCTHELKIWNGIEYIYTKNVIISYIVNKLFICNKNFNRKSKF